MDNTTEETILYTRKSASKVDMEESESFDLTNKVDITSEESSSFLGVNIHDWQTLNNNEVLSIFYFLFLKFQTCEPINFAFIRGVKEGLQQQFEYLNESESSASLMLVGSRADDIVIPGKSDIDCMVVDKTKLCVTDEELNFKLNEIDVEGVKIYLGDCLNALIMNKKDVEGVKIYFGDCLNASPGYTLVYKTKKINIKNHENHVIVWHSRELLKDLSEVNIQIHDDVLKAGPAFQTNFSQMFESCGFNVFVNLKEWSNDIVAAIPYRNGSIINKWKKRKRVQAWPSKETQHEISEMPGYIVKIDKKGSEYEQSEWRICYTTAEIKLVKSLNKVQKMLYYKLKEFASTVLKPTCPDVTSYISKNIVFWIAESVQNEYFNSRNFIPLFRSTLCVLKRCVEKHELPNYMIPERNLFDGKLTDGKTELIKILSDWIDDCPIIEGENQKALLQCYKQIKCSPRKFIQEYEQKPLFCETHLIPQISQFMTTLLKAITSTDYENMFADPRSPVYVNAIFMLLSKEPNDWMNVVFRLVKNSFTTVAKNK